SLLQSVSAGLSEAELNDMTFLCGDKIPKRRREGMRSGLDLFDLLLERGYISEQDLRFLRTLLQHIRREDLLELVQSFEERGHLADPGDEPDEHEKRTVATVVICKNLGREWKKLMRELGMSEVTLEKIERACPSDLSEQLLKGLWEWQKSRGKDAKVAELIVALRGCRLNLVADFVEK
ncbi:FADD protein, partial [Scytalopus superciliaris]|nr:FADD protein [Scytalopus superciliaris]